MKRITDSQGKNKQNRASRREGERATEQKKLAEEKKRKKRESGFQPALKWAERSKEKKGEWDSNLQRSGQRVEWFHQEATVGGRKTMAADWVVVKGWVVQLVCFKDRLHGGRMLPLWEKECWLVLFIPFLEAWMLQKPQTTPSHHLYS